MELKNAVTNISHDLRTPLTGSNNLPTCTPSNPDAVFVKVILPVSDKVISKSPSLYLIALFKKQLSVDI